MSGQIRFDTPHGPNSNWASFAKQINAKGLTPPGFQTIILTGWLFADSDKIFLILHEVGHLFDFRVPYYHSQSFVNKFGKTCSSLGIFGCGAKGSTEYPSWSIGYKYSPNPQKTTPYGNTSSIEDFAESFAATVTTLNDFPIITPFDRISQSRIAIISALIASYH